MAAKSPFKSIEEWLHFFLRRLKTAPIGCDPEFVNELLEDMLKKHIFLIW